MHRLAVIFLFIITHFFRIATMKYLCYHKTKNIRRKRTMYIQEWIRETAEKNKAAVLEIHSKVWD